MTDLAIFFQDVADKLMIDLVIFLQDVADLLKQHDNDVEFKDKEETNDDVDEEEEDEDLHLTSRAFDLAALIHTDVSKKLIKDESITITSVKSKTKSKSIKKGYLCVNMFVKFLYE